LHKNAAMTRSVRPYRGLVLTALACALSGHAGCGGVTSLSDGGQPAGKGGTGTGGAGGQTGVAGDQGTGGSSASGSGGSAGSAAGSAGTGSAGVTGGAGVTGVGGVAGTGHAGRDGGAAGAGGSMDGGAKDAADASASPCAFVPTIDRSCTVDADCLAFTHTTSCCGSAVWVGVHASEKDRFAALEAACDRTYPACGCASGPPTTDDGSIVRFGSTAGVSCQTGTCKTFSKACGHPCDVGRSCTSCMMPDAGSTSFCTLQCKGDTMCTESGRRRCLLSFANGVCVDPNMACGIF
jgi:hypothetical protein